jgi:hypothetical protein
MVKIISCFAQTWVHIPRSRDFKDESIVFRIFPTLIYPFHVHVAGDIKLNTSGSGVGSFVTRVLPRRILPIRYFLQRMLS